MQLKEETIKGQPEKLVRGSVEETLNKQLEVRSCIKRCGVRMSGAFWDRSLCALFTYSIAAPILPEEENDVKSFGPDTGRISGFSRPRT